MIGTQWHLGSIFEHKLVDLQLALSHTGDYQMYVSPSFRQPACTIFRLVRCSTNLGLQA